MNNEKMMILKMLEEGKISSEEAARLLEAAGKSSGGFASPPPTQSSPTAPPPSYSTQPSPAAPPPSYSVPPQGNGPSYSRPASGETFTEELGRKLGVLFKDMEPKLQKLSEVVAEKTSHMADALSRSLTTGSGPAAPSPSSYPPPPRPAAYPPPKSQPDRGGVEVSAELSVTSRGGELRLCGKNGQVYVRGYNGDKISAKLYYVPKIRNAAIQFTNFGDRYFLNYEENDFERVCIDAYVPESMFHAIGVSTSNGGVMLSTVSSLNVKVENSNGDTAIDNINAENIVVECNNGKLNLKDINAVSGSFENFNGGIHISGFDVAKAQITTFNGEVDLQAPRLYKFEEYAWVAESGNERLRMLLPSGADYGYNIRAKAALNTVKLGLTGISYTVNENSYAEAKSINFDSASRKVTLNVETSNAPLSIN